MAVVETDAGVAIGLTILTDRPMIHSLHVLRTVAETRHSFAVD